MRRLFLLALCFSPGCDSNAPIVPERVVAVAGDGQAFVVGGALPFPLIARVIGSDNRPLRNVMVRWTVTLGAATIGTDSVQTDAFGLASTTVTLGNQAEPIAVRAAVFGLPPVTFTATACGASTITAADTITDSLVTTDCKSSGFYTDFYSLDLTSQQALTIFDSSSTFDTYLDLYRSNGEFVAFNDDIDAGVIQHSRIHAILASGTYVVAANSFDPNTTGGYVLSVVGRAQALAGCDSVWVTRGVTVMDSVTTGDCVDSSGPYYADLVTIIAYAGSVLEIAERSTAFDAALFLLDAPDNLVAFNNDSTAGTPDAYLAYTVPRTGQYGLQVATWDTSETGAYTLDIAAPAVPSPSPKRAVAASPGPWLAPIRTPKGRASRVPLPWAGRSR